MKRIAALVALLTFGTTLLCAQQDWIHIGTGLGVEKIRMAVPDFKTASGNAPDLAKTFNDTLWNDLESAGIFEMVSKSFYPLQTPSVPSGFNAGAWGNPPPKAAMVAFGNLAADGQSLTMQGWLYDVRNTAAPQVLGKQYREAGNPEGARTAAHKFANEIIFRLGGGIQGITQSKIVYVCARGGHKEICEMDYDGANQRQLTNLGTIALSPRISPDGSRVAFCALARSSWEIRMYSLALGRMVSFPQFGGTNMSPAWSPNGHLAFSSSRSGDPEIYIADASGAGMKRVTSAHGPDMSPVFNPRTGAQIAWVSGRTGLPQIYTAGADGTNPQRLTDQGYAVSPSWSPNGQFLAFSWLRRYGPGAPGARDIYIMDVSTRQWVQLTHDGGANDFPSWSPDGRHIVFQSSRTGSEQIWSMLADGTQQKQLTRSGSNSQPNWSFK
jgi:TolB protein